MVDTPKGLNLVEAQMWHDLQEYVRDGDTRHPCFLTAPQGIWLLDRIAALHSRLDEADSEVMRLQDRVEALGP